MFQTQQHKFVNWQCDVEHRGEDFTAAVTFGNPDILAGSGKRIVDLSLPYTVKPFPLAPVSVLYETYDFDCTVSIYYYLSLFFYFVCLL